MKPNLCRHGPCRSLTLEGRRQGISTKRVASCEGEEKTRTVYASIPNKQVAFEEFLTGTLSKVCTLTAWFSHIFL